MSWVQVGFFRNTHDAMVSYLICEPRAHSHPPVCLVIHFPFFHFSPPLSWDLFSGTDRGVDSALPLHPREDPVHQQHTEDTGSSRTTCLLFCYLPRVNQNLPQHHHPVVSKLRLLIAEERASLSSIFWVQQEPHRLPASDLNPGCLWPEPELAASSFDLDLRCEQVSGILWLARMEFKTWEKKQTCLWSPSAIL